MNKWIEWDNARNYPEFNTVNSKRLFIICDDGNVYRYDEDWGMNIVTHFYIAPKLPNETP